MLSILGTKFGSYKKNADQEALFYCITFHLVMCMLTAP